MTAPTDDDLWRSWQDAKEREKAAQEERREIEDAILARLALAPDWEGTANFGPLKIACRLSTSVDSDLAQQLAAEHGMSDHLTTVFRWKPELRVREWAGCHESIRRALSPAITTKAARPSFSKKEEK